MRYLSRCGADGFDVSGRLPVNPAVTLSSVGRTGAAGFAGFGGFFFSLIHSSLGRPRSFTRTTPRFRGDHWPNWPSWLWLRLRLAHPAEPRATSMIMNIAYGIAPQTPIRTSIMAGRKWSIL